MVRCFLGGLVCADYWRAEESGTLSLGLIRSLLGADNGRAIQSGTLSLGLTRSLLGADNGRAIQNGTLSNGWSEIFLSYVPIAGEQNKVGRFDLV